MYPNPQVASFVDEQFTPVRMHVREQAEGFKQLGARYGAQWTPTILVVDAEGEERHRIEGFLPVDEFLPQLAVGLGHAAFKRGDFEGAERWFRHVTDTYSQSDAAAEALYWAGVAKYKKTGDAAALAETALRFKEQHQDSTWAKKASVWAT